MIEWLPTVRLETVKVATPFIRLPAPSGVAEEPSKKVTVPVGVPTEDDTIAVNVTAFCSSTVGADVVNPTAGVALVTQGRRI